MISNEVVLTSIKINALKDIIRIMFEMHEQRFVVEKNNNIVTLRNNANGFGRFSTVISAEDEWFILSIHSTEIDESLREVCATMDDTCNGGTEDDGSVYGFNAREKVIIDKRNGCAEKYPILTNVEDIDAFLFQSQTIYSDSVTLALLVQYLSSGFIKEKVYLSYNISKLLKISEDDLDKVLNFISHIWEDNKIVC